MKKMIQYAGKIACCWERSKKICYTTKCTLGITFSTRIANGEIYNGEFLNTLIIYTCIFLQFFDSKEFRPKAILTVRL